MKGQPSKREDSSTQGPTMCSATDLERSPRLAQALTDSLTLASPCGRCSGNLRRLSKPVCRAKGEREALQSEMEGRRRFHGSKPRSTCVQSRQRSKTNLPPHRGKAGDAVYKRGFHQACFEAGVHQRKRTKRGCHNSRRPRRLNDPAGPWDVVTGTLH